MCKKSALTFFLFVFFVYICTDSSSEEVLFEGAGVAKRMFFDKKCKKIARKFGDSIFITTFAIRNDNYADVAQLARASDL